MPRRPGPRPPGGARRAAPRARAAARSSSARACATTRARPSARRWPATRGRGVAAARAKRSNRRPRGALPDHPDALRQWLGRRGARGPASRRCIAWSSGCGSASGRRPTRVRRREWMTARAAAHQVLAARGSTVALYDLRETIESGEPAPVEMLAALGVDRGSDLPGADRGGLRPGALERRPGDGRPRPRRRRLVARAPGGRLPRRSRPARSSPSATRLTKRIRARWPDAAAACSARRSSGSRRPPLHRARASGIDAASRPRRTITEDEDQEAGSREGSTGRVAGSRAR